MRAKKNRVKAKLGTACPVEVKSGGDGFRTGKGKRKSQFPRDGAAEREKVFHAAERSVNGKNSFLGRT